MSEHRYERAAELLSFQWQQADKAQASGDMAETVQQLDSLARHLPPDIYRQAIERGKLLQLSSILEQLSDELANYSHVLASVDIPSNQPLLDPLTSVKSKFCAF